METKYFFGFHGWLPHTRMYVSEEEAENAIKTYEYLNAVLGIEESFDILKENFIDFEKSLHTVLVNSFALSNIDTVLYSKNERYIIRTLTNFLTSCSSFMDHTNKLLKETLFNQTKFEESESVRHSLFDENDEYKVMYELRNILQHRNKPITLEFNKQFAKGDEEFAVESLSVVLDVKNVLFDENLKKYTRDVLLKYQDKKLEVNKFARKYFTCMCVYFKKIRVLEAETLKQKRIDYEVLFEKYEQLKTDPANRIQRLIYLNKEEGDTLYGCTMSDSLIRDIDYLNKKNRLGKDYSRHEMRI